MDEAAAAAASTGEQAPAGVSKALGALRLLWGDKFLIGHDEQGYWSAPGFLR